MQTKGSLRLQCASDQPYTPSNASVLLAATQFSSPKMLFGSGKPSQSVQLPQCSYIIGTLPSIHLLKSGQLLVLRPIQ